MRGFPFFQNQYTGFSRFGGKERKGVGGAVKRESGHDDDDGRDADAARNDADDDGEEGHDGVRTRGDDDDDLQRRRLNGNAYQPDGEGGLGSDEGSDQC
eukprot:423141-Pleurochrysis_carterae.AAC.1